MDSDVKLNTTNINCIKTHFSLTVISKKNKNVKQIILLLLYVLLFHLDSGCQDTEITYFSLFGNKTTKEKATSYSKTTYNSDNIFVEYFNTHGAIERSETYMKDSPNVENGLFLFYHRNGAVATRGQYVDGLLSGIWKMYDEKGEIIDSINYNLIENNRIVEYDTIYEKNNSSLIKPDNEQFKYIEIIKKLYYPISAANRKKSGTVNVEFVLNKIGEVTNMKVLNNVDKDLDREAMRAIAECGFGKPYENNGRPVNAKVVLRINFMLQD